MAYIFVKKPTEQDPNEWYAIRLPERAMWRADLEQQEYQAKYQGFSVLTGTRMTGPYTIIGSGYTISDILGQIYSAIEGTVNSNHKGYQTKILNKLTKAAVELERFHPETEIFIDSEDFPPKRVSA